MALKNFSIRNYEDLEKLSVAFAKALRDIGSPYNCVIEFKVSEETFDYIAKQLWNKRLTFVDLTEYTEMSLTLNQIRFKLNTR